MGDANVLYCRVKQGEYRARFLRHAYYHLAEHFLTDDGEHFSILIGGRRYPIRIGDAVDSTDAAGSKPPLRGVH